jgi:signal transduction histidine kinase
MLIADEILPKFFPPVFMTKAQGRGFGLAIFRSVVVAHGGKISVETSLDKGTHSVLFCLIEP